VDGTSILVKREEAECAARVLVDAGIGVQSILLFGSVARGDARSDSDIDLMAVSEDPLRDPLPRGSGRQSPVSLVCHTWESLRRAREDDWSFFVHLREEGRILHEVEPRLREELDAVRRPSAEAQRSCLRRELRCLERYDDLSRFRAGYLFPLARIFRTIRFSCMLDNTASGHIAFRREAAFDLFAERRGAVAEDVERVRWLWAFHAWTQGRRRELPFSYEDRRPVVESVGSAQRIVRAILEDAA
jgi:predicted nucleotidyltransferase